MIFTLQFLGAIYLDLLFGDPQKMPHPVQGIGWLCRVAETRARRLFPSSSPIMAGAIAFLLVFSCTLLVPTVLLFVLHRISPVVEGLAAVILLYTSIACRDLRTHSMNVYQALQENDSLDQARIEVAKIVGRDTATLDRQGICRACVETVAENLVDGITAPVFFAVLASLVPGGDLLSPISLAVAGAYGYKAINTMDSMYGYKNEQYLYFGRWAARADDGANFLPARVSGLLLVLAAWLLGHDGRQAWRIFLRDRLQHASPNSGHTEAAVAGSLGIQLGGDACYFGKTVHKPTLGDALRPLDAADIPATNRLMLATAGLFCALLLLGRYLVTGG